MTKMTSFRALDFVRRVRNEQATLLDGKSVAEITAFFSGHRKGAKRPTTRSTRTRAKTARAG